MVTRKPLPDNATPVATNTLMPPITQRESSSSHDSIPGTSLNVENDLHGGRPYGEEHDGQLREDGGDAARSDQVSEALRPGRSQDLDSSALSLSNAAGSEVAHGSGTAFWPHGQCPPSASAKGGSESFMPDLSPRQLKPETNPFKRKDVARYGSSSFSTTRNNTSPPTQALAELTVADTSTNPWPASHGSGDSKNMSQPNTSDLDLLTPHPHACASPATQSESPGQEWPASTNSSENQAGRGTTLSVAEQSDSAHNWEEASKSISTAHKGKGKDTGDDASLTNAAVGRHDDWSLIDPAAVPAGDASLPQSQKVDVAHESLVKLEDGEESETATMPLGLPSEQMGPRHSPRLVDSKSETYEIKNINWHDHYATANPRTTPILVQNANGPCPLLALVNALTLTTPATQADTTLVQVLRSREQISLGLLLDAVFDELMSPRRTAEGTALPDVGELYDFLKGLHTGMNVDPRFVPSPEVVEAFGRTSMTHLHPSERRDLIPGTFEETVEMALYSAFSIPLIHGWLPTQSEPAFDALSRQAASYDHVQSLLFREEELEQKLSDASQQGLSEDEQQLYQDIITIRCFLETSATQLTPWGLEVITRAMKPGLVAILFRNDHFSTLYRHPESRQLLVLVTDAGYASHAEVVWESLVDVNGLGSEFLSGDFHVVGGANAQQGTGTSRETEWYDAPSSSAAAASGSNQDGLVPISDQDREGQQKQTQPAGSDVIQEDHDLALAIQLQEEEDERHRQQQARRHRERELSEQYIEQQAQQPAPQQRMVPNRGGHTAAGRRPESQASLVSPRRSSSITTGLPPGVPTGYRQNGQVPNQQVRPLVPPVIPQRRTTINRPVEREVDDAPPSYEQAQNSDPYVPPVGHPSHPSSSNAQPSEVQGFDQQPNPSLASRPANVRPMASRPSLGSGRMRPVPPGAAIGGTTGSRERDCVLM